MKKSDKIIMISVIASILIFIVPVGIFIWQFVSSFFNGDYHITDPDKYSRKDAYRVIEYFPESIDDYQVNSYSYNAYNFLDSCTEIYLDITATDKQFDQIVQDAEKSKEVASVKPAFYDSDYTEIIFCDNYEKADNDVDEYSKGQSPIGNAEIKKIIYNEKTHNIIFEYLYAADSNIYPLDEVVYFKHFHISEDDYVKHADSYYEKSDD